MRPRAAAGLARRASLLVAALLQLHYLVLAQDDDFEYFRCDACSATFFKINKTLVERYGRRAANLQAFEFIEILEGICNSAFTKDEFGVKTHEGKKYLFGPGVTDHIPDKGFGQMGMGDYDKRLTSYCRMFTEDVGEEELQRIFVRDGGINRTALCLSPCSSSASGTGAISSEPRKPRKRPPPPPTPAPAPPPRKASRPPAPPPPAPQPPPAAAQPPPNALGTGVAASAAAAAPADSLEQAVAMLPRLSTMQLRWLGEAVMGELAQRASAAGASSPRERAQTSEL